MSPCDFNIFKTHIYIFQLNFLALDRRFINTRRYENK